MNKLTYSDITNEQLVDIRNQTDFQTGYIAGSLNLNPTNFEKYGTDFLRPDQAIIFITDKANQANLENLHADAKKLGFKSVAGYTLIEETPSQHIQQIETVPVDDFLENNDAYILLDLRNPTEITRPAPEKNLVNIPLEDLTQGYQSLDHNKDIYTLCGSGNRATTAASYLTAKGYKPVVIEGGMKAVQEETNK